ncbi:MAG: hypothetical protein AABM30_05965 [Actinomycetota bacterium]
MSTVAVEHARHQWEEGHRKVQSYSTDRALFLHLHAQVNAVVDELNRRVGQTFTLVELADAYQRSDRWLHEVLGPGAHLATVQDAAFYLYARGALDYKP